MTDGFFMGSDWSEPRDRTALEAQLEKAARAAELERQALKPAFEPIEKSHEPEEVVTWPAGYGSGV